MEQKCANCGNGKWRDGITAITDTCIKCHYVDKGALVPQPGNWIPKVQTNSDRMIRMLQENDAYGLLDLWQVIFEDGVPSEDYFKWWLKQPAEVSDNEKRMNAPRR